MGAFGVPKGTHSKQIRTRTKGADSTWPFGDFKHHLLDSPSESESVCWVMLQAEDIGNSVRTPTAAPLLRLQGPSPPRLAERASGQATLMEKYANHVEGVISNLEQSICLETGNQGLATKLEKPRGTWLVTC